MITGSHATLQTWAVSQLLCWLVSANTMLEIQLLKYSNIAEKRYDGQCCHALCLTNCDHKFDFCLDAHRPEDFEPHRCTLMRSQTGEFPDQNEIVFGTHMSGVLNPIKMTFQGFPDMVDFKLAVSDDENGWSGTDLVDKFKVSIGGPVYKAPSLAQWTNVFLRGQRSEDKSTLELRFRVYCMLNYYGDDCMTFCEAKSDIINGFYTCDPDTGAKVCRAGYLRAKDCKEKLDDCEGNECKNGATCVDLYRTYDCICLTGYTGGYCELLVNKCSFAPCQNGATCLRNGDDYTCQCTGGYVGRNCTLQRCFIPTTCHNGGTCYGAGQCLCPASFLGDDCSQNVCQDMTCDNGGTCDSGKCFCKAGFTGVSCSIELCDLIVCHHGGTCRAGLCTCRAGYEGDQCEVNIDDCANVPCKNSGTCRDMVNDYRCKCLPGYDGRNCTLHRCSIPTTCHNGGTCYGVGQCLCPAGFLGDDCSQNVCQDMTCDNGGTCDSGKCFCKAGFTGVSCSIELCDLIVCHHGGTCRAGLCTCRTGYEGDQCEVNIDDCANEPCKNDGTCRDMVSDYRCKCLPGYDGRNCTLHRCSIPTTCHNGGTCYGAGQCRCPAGLLGDDCSFTAPAGLKCYHCSSNDAPSSCGTVIEPEDTKAVVRVGCTACQKTVVNTVVTRSCLLAQCSIASRFNTNVHCCDTDLCNNSSTASRYHHCSLLVMLLAVITATSLH